jgi:porin
MKQQFRRARIYSFTALTSGMLGLGMLFANAAQGESINTWYQQQMLNGVGGSTVPGENGITGDWDGERTSLAERGIKFSSQLQMQVAGVPSGGRGQGTDYDQQFTVQMDADLQKLVGWDGALFHLAVTDRAGRNVGTDYVGSKIEPLNDYGAGENFRLSNMSLEQNLFNKRVNILIGYYPDGNEFANSGALLCSFLVNGFCGHPNALSADSSGEQNSPGAQWGGRVKVFATPNLYEAVGVYDVNPSLQGTDDNGFKLGFVNSTGAIVFNEIGYTSHIGPAKMIGHFKIGGYYDTSTVADIANAKVNVAGRYGGYLLADQMIYSFQPGTARGWIVFGDMTLNDKKTSPEESYFDTGTIFRGILPSRPADTLAFGWIIANANTRKLNQLNAALNKAGDSDPGYFTAEQVVELDYNYYVGPWVTLHPTVQYWIDPGAITNKQYANAWLLGGQVTINF